jgi:sugar diacid utilization regulator/putative methionine-R-sulfoxide reductase with GAF domain
MQPLAVERRAADDPDAARCPEAWLDSALELVRRAADAQACSVVWRDARDAIRRCSAGDGELEEGLAAELAAGEDRAAPACAGACVMPLRDAAGQRAGLLALDVEVAAERLPLVAAAAEHLRLLLDSVRGDADRTTAYEALLEVSSQLHAEELNTDELLGLIVRQAHKLMDVDVTWLALIDEERQRVVVKVASGAQTDSFVRMWVGVGVGVGGLAVRDRRPVLVRDHRQYDHPTTDLVKRTLQAEGVVSLLSVPMVFEGRPVGVLYGGSRTPTDFSETAVSVFTALAGQAAVSIANSRLYRDLAAQNDTLERTFALHRSLSDAALTGGGMAGIARELATIIDRDVVVERTDVTSRAMTYTPAGADSASRGSPAVDEDAAGHAVDIVAGDEVLGRIQATGTGPLSDLEQNALQQAATVMALEILKERAALEAEWRLRGELLEEILQADGDWSEGLLLRSERFGVDLGVSHCLAVIEPLEARDPAHLLLVVRTALHRDLGDGTGLVCKRGDRVLVALAQELEPASAAIRVVLDKAHKAGIPAVCGISTPRGNLTVGLKEAEGALGLARAAGPGELVCHDSLGPLRFLLDAPDTTEMARLVVELLGPIAAYDRKRGGGEILETLRVYLDVGGNRPAVAKRCHIHVSTVKYRMRKASEFLDRSLSDPQTRFELTLAYRLLDLLATLGLDPLQVGAAIRE